LGTTVSLALFSGLFSCVKDLGNYDYVTINAVDSINHIWDVRAASGDMLELKPELVFNEGGDEKEFDFTWYHRVGDSEVDKGEWKVLQEGRDLSVKVADPIGTPGQIYTLAFEMVNKTTGMAYRRVFRLRVESPFAIGFAALVEQDKAFDIDMVALTPANTFHLHKHILATSGSNLPREDGEVPINILTNPDLFAPNPYARKGEYSLMVLTDKRTTRLNKDDYTWDPSYDISNIVERNSYLDNEYVKKGLPIVASKMVYAFFTGSRIYMYHKEPDGTGNWYFYTDKASMVLMSVKMNGIRSTDPAINGTRFNPSEYVAAMNDGIMYFDVDNNRFMYGTFSFQTSYYSAQTWYADPIPAEPDNALFKLNDPNEGLLYMGMIPSASGTYPRGYAILKQADGTYKYIEFGSTISMPIWSNPAATIRTRYSIIPADCNIADFKFMARPAMEDNNPFLYYVTKDNRVMMIDLSSEKAIVGDITQDVLTEKGYDEITLFEYTLPECNSLSSSSADIARNALAIGTYNSSIGKNDGGKLAFYSTVKPAGNLIVAKYPDKPTEEGYQIDMVWKGMGRIVGLNYKQK
jgi:hypothetical protein